MRRVITFFRELDGWILLGAGILIALGLVAIWSVGISRGASDAVKQLIAFGLGTLVMLFLSSVHPRTFYQFRYVFVVIGIVAMVMVLLFGHVINGTRGWFRIGSFTLQPVEFVKFALIIVLAAILPLNARLRSLRAVVSASVITGVFVLLTLKQPDFGTAMVLMSLWGVMLLVSGVPRRYVVLLFVLAALSGVLAWKFGLQDYQRERVLTFLDPSRDPQGRGYNVTQAQIAIGSGGWFGRGFASGSQSQLRFLPESQTDFVFSVIAEELGLSAVVLLWAAIALIVYRLFRLARRAPDDFTQFVTIGAATLISVESFVSIGGNIGLVPMTGITLPFVSSGGSSLLAHMALLGLILSIHRVSLRGGSLRQAVWQRE